MNFSDQTNQNFFHIQYFDFERKSDIDELFIKNVPVIYAWGVNDALFELAEKASNTLNSAKPVGLRKDNTHYAYYHPLPPSTPKQKEWVTEISKMLNSL
ncbi:MAG: hypothetical protein ACI9J2_001318 [Saprospiraceae bacterium]|jgi:hypothetical protein